jgi:alpha-tubulin suppressor-like RCC1 family protein
VLGCVGSAVNPDSWATDPDAVQTVRWSGSAPAPTPDGAPSAQPGLAPPKPELEPLQAAVAPPVSVVLGLQSACALLENGRVACWGVDTGTFGRGLPPHPLSQVDVHEPQLVPHVVGTELSGGATRCVRSPEGEVWCWGFLGKLFDPTMEKDWGTLPQKIPGLTNVVEVDAIRYQVVTRHGDGAVRVWGHPLDCAHPGLASLDPARSLRTPTVVPELAGALRIDLGIYGGCAIMPPDRHLKCWGTQYIHGDWVTAAGPEPVARLTGVVKTTLGEHHRCALLENGTVRCWGRNADGELGNGSTLESLVPVQVRDVTTAVDIAGQSDMTCAVLRSGRVKCWGNDHYGLLAEPRGIHPVPREHPQMHDVTQLDVMVSFACGCLKGGAVQCWGELDDGAQALNAALGRSRGPERSTGSDGLSAPLPVTQLALGPNFSCALHRDGRVSCWGANDDGQVGSNSLRDELRPRPIEGLNGVTQISAGFLHACARLSNGSARCWGSNGNGALGAGPDAPQRSPVPIPVLGVSDVAEVAAGGFSCLRHQSGAVSCWGDYSPGSGRFRPLGSEVPVRVPGVRDATAVDVGGLHACALTPTGASCWTRSVNKPATREADAWRSPAYPLGGSRGARALTVGSSVCQLDSRGCVSCPVRDGSRRPAFDGACNVQALAEGGDLSCVLYATGQVACGPQDGALVDVPGVRATHISVGNAHACALTTDQQVLCWGDNRRGQLGDGGTNPSAAPRPVRWR